MRTRLWLSCTLLILATNAPAAETPPQALARLPPLPAAATSTLD